MKKTKKTKKLICQRGCGKGFSFIEGILAIFVVTVGMLMVIQLVSSGLSYAINSRYQATAVLLAQEGVEVVRGIRDNNWAQGEDTFKGFPGNNNNPCTVNYNSTVLSSCNNDIGNKALNLESGAYTHNSGLSTRFKREILISYLDGAGDSTNKIGAATARVDSVVTWGTADFPNTIDAAHCNASSASQCAFATVILSKWGE